MLDSLGQVLPHAARAFGERIALVVGEKSFSFRELDGLSDALAANLVKLGVKPGDRVTLYAPNSWEWIVSYYGALKAGAMINPVNVMLTPAEVAYRHARLRREGADRQRRQDRAGDRGRRRGPHDDRVRRRGRRRRDAVRRTRRRAADVSSP